MVMKDGSFKYNERRNNIFEPLKQGPTVRKKKDPLF